MFFNFPINIELLKSDLIGLNNIRKKKTSFYFIKLFRLNIDKINIC
jgi:hypothetical protein